LKEVGRVLHISPSRKAVVKAKRVPRIGEAVVDEEKRRVGMVSDVFGPTVFPYVEVEVKSEDPQKLVDRVLYVSSSKRKVRSRRK